MDDEDESYSLSVAQVIEQLMAVEDKSLPVYVYKWEWQAMGPASDVFIEKDKVEIM